MAAMVTRIPTENSDEMVNARRVESSVAGQGMEVNVRVDLVVEALGHHHHSHSEVVPAQAGTVEGEDRLHG